MRCVSIVTGVVYVAATVSGRGCRRRQRAQSHGWCRLRNGACTLCAGRFRAQSHGSIEECIDSSIHLSTSAAAATWIALPMELAPTRLVYTFLTQVEVAVEALVLF